MAGKIIADIIEAPYDAIRMNVANVTVLTANSSGLTFVPTGNVNVNIGGASANLTLNLLTANGVKFPATQVPSADANTLDDYEEGTWTPTIGAASSNPSNIAYSIQSGAYTKIGNVVYVRLRVNFTFTNGTGSGALNILGLPFTSSNNPQPKSPPQQDNITYTGFTYLEMGCQQNTAIAGLGKNRSGGSANGLAIGDCAGSSGTDINGGFFYFV